MKVGNKVDKRSTFVILTSFSKKSNSEIACLKQGSEINDFGLKQGQVLKASVKHLHPSFL